MKTVIVSRVRIVGALLALGSIYAVPATALAQERDTSAHRGFCFRPQPRCDWSPITEFGAAYGSNGPEAIWQLGLRRSVRGRSALGATVAITTAPAVTLAPVVRVKLTPWVALDVAPGLVVHGSRRQDMGAEYPTPDVWIMSSAEGLAPAFAIDASLNLRDWASLYVRSSVFSYTHVRQSQYTRTETPSGPGWLYKSTETVSRRGTIGDHWIGVRAGSHAGLGLGALSVVAGIAWAYAWRNQN